MPKKGHECGLSWVTHHDTQYLWRGRFVATSVVAPVPPSQSKFGDRQHVGILVQHRPVWKYECVGFDVFIDQQLQYVNLGYGVRYGHSKPVSTIDQRAAKPAVGIAVFCIDLYGPNCVGIIIYDTGLGVYARHSSWPTAA